MRWPLWGWLLSLLSTTANRRAAVRETGDIRGDNFRVPLKPLGWTIHCRVYNWMHIFIVCNITDIYIYILAYTYCRLIQLLSNAKLDKNTQTNNLNTCILCEILFCTDSVKVYADCLKILKIFIVLQQLLIPKTIPHFNWKIFYKYLWKKNWKSIYQNYSAHYLRRSFYKYRQ